MNPVIVDRLRAVKQTAWEAAKALREQAIAEHRELTASEQEQWNIYTQEMDDANARLTDIFSLEARAQKADEFREMASAILPTEHASLQWSGGRQAPGEVRVLGPTERFAATAARGPDANLSLSQWLRAVVTGERQGLAPELFAQSIGSDTGGGYLVPEILSGNVIDRARNLAAVIRAGALTVPMDRAELHLARVSGDPTAGWKQESVAGTASDLTFERVTLRAKTLMALVKSSVEVFEDADELERTVENALGEALALELDRAALLGTGAAGEPLGIVNQTGVTTTASVGSPADYVKFVDDPIKSLREANATEPFAFLAAPRTYHSLGKLVTGITSDKTRLKPPAEWDSVYTRKFATNQIPTNLGAGTNESQAFVGDFGQLFVGMRRNLVIEATRVGADADSSAFTNLQVWIRAYLRADVALAHPNHFVVLDGILA